MPNLLEKSVIATTVGNRFVLQAKMRWSGDWCNVWRVEFPGYKVKYHLASDSVLLESPAACALGNFYSIDSGSIEYFDNFTVTSGLGQQLFLDAFYAGR
jgi:hypothetical protein